MADVTQLSLVIGSAALINSVANIKENRDAVPPLVASGVMFGTLAVFGELTRKPELSLALAYVFLIASIIMRGIPLIRATNSLANSKAPAATIPGPKQIVPIPGPVTR